MDPTQHAAGFAAQAVRVASAAESRCSPVPLAASVQLKVNSILLDRWATYNFDPPYLRAGLCLDNVP